MSELISPPSNGKWIIHAGSTTQQIRNWSNTHGHRLISIKRTSSTDLFAAVAIQNFGFTSGWDTGISEAELRNRLADQDSRLIALDAYDVDGATKCAGVWIRNDDLPSDPAWSRWAVDLSESDLQKILDDEGGKLTTIRAYFKRGHAGLVRVYAAIWIEDDGIPWEWRPEVDGGDYYKRLVDELSGYAIVSQDAFPVVGGKVAFAVVSWQDAAPNGAYSFSDCESKDLDNRVRGLCCYPMDVCQNAANRYAVTQFAYPPVEHPGKSELLTFTGNATTGALSELVETINVTPEIHNVTAFDVKLTRAVRFLAGPGGWCWFLQDTLNTTDFGRLFYAASNTIAAGTSPAPGSAFGLSSGPPVVYVATQVEANTSSGNYQEAVTCLSVDGSAPSVAAPVSVGVQGPLEILWMTDRRPYIEVKGQIINFSSRPCTIQGLFLRLLDVSGKTVKNWVLPLDFLVDFDPAGNPIDAIQYDPKHHTDRPLPRFRFLIPVPDEFNNGHFEMGGHLEVDLHVQMKPLDPASPPDAIECFSDRQTPDVSLRIPEKISSPLKGRVHWGNGPAASVWHAHWGHGDRYCYDMGHKNADGQLFTGTGDRNEDYVCWDQPVLAARAGKVIAVVGDQPDNRPFLPVAERGKPNYVIIQSGDLLHIYFHLKQHSVTVTLGEDVSEGREIGHVGDSGFSDAPHLHFGFYRIGPAGVLGPVPVSINANLQVPKNDWDFTV